MKKLQAIIFLYTCAICTLGCKKLITVGPPEDQLITKTVFENDQTAISALTGLYANMMRSSFPLSYNIAYYTGLYSDELDYKQSAAAALAIYNYSLNSKDAITNGIWTNGYNYIYQANSILGGIENSNNLSQGIKSQLKGEALLLRAFWHFNLILLYGNIPILTSTDYINNSKLVQSSPSEVYSQIVKDIEEAKMLLSEKYVEGNSITESLDRVRPNYFTACALLSRVFLYIGDWVNAEKQASIIISSDKYKLEDIASVFKKQSKECIWQLELPVTTNVYNTYEANYFTLTTKPSSVSTLRSATISPLLLSKFELSDQRATEWISSYTDISTSPNIKYNYPSKYKSRTSATIDEYTNCFRLGETILIRAEALARQNKLPEAINDTDKIRFRSGIPLLRDIDHSISQQALIDTIIAERQRELFCEWGLRWYDIRRVSMTEQILSAIANYKGVDLDMRKVLWPIPLNDIINNRNLVQNDGYN